MATLAPWKGYVKENLLRHPTIRDALSSDRIEGYCRRAGHMWRKIGRASCRERV